MEAQGLRFEDPRAQLRRAHAVGSERGVRVLQSDCRLLSLRSSTGSELFVTCKLEAAEWRTHACGLVPLGSAHCGQHHTRAPDIKIPQATLIEKPLLSLS